MPIRDVFLLGYFFDTQPLTTEMFCQLYVFASNSLIPRVRVPNKSHLIKRTKPPNKLADHIVFAEKPFICRLSNVCISRREIRQSLLTWPKSRYFPRARNNQRATSRKSNIQCFGCDRSSWLQKTFSAFEKSNTRPKEHLVEF